jgi:hypothetical protein
MGDKLYGRSLSEKANELIKNRRKTRMDSRIRSGFFGIPKCRTPYKSEEFRGIPCFIASGILYFWYRNQSLKKLDEKYGEREAKER